MPSWKKRGGNPDKAQAPLVKLARRLGASVAITSKVGHGVPDSWIGFRGQDVPAEFKTPGEMGKRGQRKRGGKLREKQEDFQRTWQGRPVQVIETGQDLVRVLLELDANRPDLRPAPGPGIDLVAMAVYLADQDIRVADLQAGAFGHLLRAHNIERSG